LTLCSLGCNVIHGGRGPPFEGRNEPVDIPNWVKWAAVIGLVIWLISDPKGMAKVATSIWSGLTTFLKELG
jgi:hypothetical protein